MEKMALIELHNKIEKKKKWKKRRRRINETKS